MRATTLITAWAALLLVSAAQSQSMAAGDRSLGQVARELRQKKAAIAVASVQVPADPEIAYRREVSQSLAGEDFARLEKMAKAARSQKSRFPGGIWKLWIFYESAAEPAADKRSDAAWQAYIGKLQRWISAYPQSITARVALAETYHGYAWMARGSGYSNSVSEDGWKLMADREEMAKQTLIEAASLELLDPHWFAAMQHVALGQGWAIEKRRALLEAAIEFEPAYYHVYREHANMLLPRWYGEAGEAEAFAEEISSRIGGKQGAFVYFEVATVLNCLCDGEDHLTTMSWPKIKEGYAAIEELYGSSKLKRNRFAMMAAKARDKAAAQRVLAQIGDDWDEKTWIRKASFDNVKAWTERQ